jgi:hypothetical protein
MLNAVEDTSHGDDSALAELTSDPASRKKFLRMAGTGGAGALSLLIAACGSSKKKAASTATSTSTPASSSGSSTKPSGDLAIVNYALTLEYLEADFYAKVIASGLFKGAELDAIKKFGDTEHQHVVALEGVAKQLGTPVAKPKTKFPLKDAKSIVMLAATVENVGAAAYLGAAPMIKSPDILAAALSIHSVEARHAATLNTMLGKSPTPDGAFGKPMTMAQVLPIAKKFIVA